MFTQKYDTTNIHISYPEFLHMHVYLAYVCHILLTTLRKGTTGTKIHTGCSKSEFTVVSTQNTVYSCIYSLLYYLYYNWKPTFAHPCIL